MSRGAWFCVESVTAENGAKRLFKWREKSMTGKMGAQVFRINIVVCLGMI